MKLNTNYIYDYNEAQAYDRNYFYNPDGKGVDFNTSHTLILQFSHTLSSSTFYTIGASWFEREVKYHLYDLAYEPANDGSGDLIETLNAGGPHYVHPYLFLTDDSYSFLTGGTDMNRFHRSSTTKLLKFDVSSQLDNANLVKVGAEYCRQRVLREHHAAADCSTDGHQPRHRGSVYPHAHPSTLVPLS
jgi:hypothetical protein